MHLRVCTQAWIVPYVVRPGLMGDVVAAVSAVESAVTGLNNRNTGVSGSSMGQPKHDQETSLKVADTRSVMLRLG